MGDKKFRAKVHPKGFPKRKLSGDIRRYPDQEPGGDLGESLLEVKEMVLLRASTTELATPDALFILHALEEASIHSDLKFQKTGFFSELSLLAAGSRWPSFAFYRYRFGPYCRDFQAALRELQKRGLAQGTGYACTDRGKELLAMAIPALREVPENAPIFEVVDKTIAFCRPKTGKQLMEAAYRLRWKTPDGKTVTTGEIAESEFLVEPSADEREMTFPAWLRSYVGESLATPESAFGEARQRIHELELDALASLRSYSAPAADGPACA